MPEQLPTAECERLDVIDALRGFALLGVLMVNLRDLSLFELLPEEARAALPTAAWDSVIGRLMTLFVDGKAMTIFTILFGVGFALQMERVGKRSAFFVRRMAVLFAIGVVHAFFWWGDILLLYALCGILLLALARLPARWLAVLGVAVALFAAPLLRPWIGTWLPTLQPATAESAGVLAAFSGPSWSEMLQANAHHFTWMRVTAWGLPFFTIGRILLGATLRFSGVLRDPEAHQKFWTRLALVLLPVGLALTLFVMLRDEEAIGAAGDWWKSVTARNLVRIARSGGSLALGLSYVAIFIRLFQYQGARTWLRQFSPIGRMALTNYLMQTALCMALFYGVGFGLGPRFGLPGLLMVCALLFAFQLWFSQWWLARYRFGPAEWFWRMLTYGRFIVLRREPA